MISNNNPDMTLSLCRPYSYHVHPLRIKEIYDSWSMQYKELQSCEHNYIASLFKLKCNLMWTALYVLIQGCKTLFLHHIPIQNIDTTASLIWIRCGSKQNLTMWFQSTHYTACVNTTNPDIWPKGRVQSTFNPDWCVKRGKSVHTEIVDNAYASPDMTWMTFCCQGGLVNKSAATKKLV